MYLACNFEVEFPETRGRRKFKFTTVNTFKIDSSWQSLTNNMDLTISKALFFDEVGKVYQLVKAGDPIVLRGGYNGELMEEFRGFVSQILDDMPVLLKCEDNMYVMKRTGAHKIYKRVKLAQLLRDIVPSQYKIDAMDVELGSVELNRTTVSQTLLMLKDNYGIYSYFVGDTLVSGKIYEDNPVTEVVKYCLSGGTKNIIKNDLKYRTKDDVKIKVRMVNYNDDGTKSEVVVGDDEGQEQRLVCTNHKNAADLKVLAQKELDRLKIDRFSGTLTSFAIPFVQEGYTASIINTEYPERSGDYYVDAVTTSLNDMGAYHRVVKIGPRAAKQS